MVYCDLKSNEKGLLTYYFGGSNDRTGIVIFNTHDGSFKIAHKQENSMVFSRHLDKLARRARALYEKGIVKEKLAYEIG